MSNLINEPADYYMCLLYDVIPHYGYDLIRDNEHLVENELNKIFNLIRGRNTPIAPYITSKDGKKSERKIQELINNIMKCWRYNVPEEYRDSEYHPSALDYKIQKKIIRGILYCAINGVAEAKDVVFRPVETFGDLMGITKGIYHRELMYETEYQMSGNFKFFWEYCGATNCFSMMAYVYYLLTGKFIASDYKDDDWELSSDYLIEHYRKSTRSRKLEVNKRKFLSRVDYEWTLYTKGWRATMTDEEYRERELEHEMYDPESERDPCEVKYYEELKRLTEECKEKSAEWASSVTNAEKVLQCYRQTRELIKKYTDKDNYVSGIPEMIDCFLYVNGLSDCNNDDTLVKALLKIRNAERVIENDRRRRGLL